jgi:predicted HTH domain antitoxin
LFFFKNVGNMSKQKAESGPKTTKITLELPENLDMSEFDVTMMLAAKLYESGKISSGQGAEMVGLSKRAFIELLGKYGVSVFGYDFDELENDLKNG